MTEKTRTKIDRAIIFNIDVPLLKRLDSFTEKKRWNRSFTIREAIKAYIKDGG